MKYLKLIVLQFFLLAMGLTACGVQPAVEPTPMPIPPTDTPQPVATVAQLSVITGTNIITNPTCHTESITKVVNLAIAPGVLPIAEVDWQQGPVDAPITVIEYSDFQ